MVNTYTKGNRNQLKCKQDLQKDGYLTDSKPRVQYHSPDLFTMFDVIALKGSEFRLIQVKSNMSDFYTARIEIAKWMAIHGVTAKCEVWCYLGRSQWRKQVIS